MTVQELDTLSLGQLVTQEPAAAAVLEALGIDYCCGGKASVKEACHRAHLDISELVSMLEKARRQAPAGPDWQAAPLGQLSDHIIQTHHAYLRRELPVLHERMQKVLTAHGQDRPYLHEVAQALRTLSQELLDHLDLEENVVFPVLVTPQGQTAQAPVLKLEHDHSDAGALLARLRQLTHGYQPPEGACPTFQALYAGLQELERDTHMHIHLENNILFPRALSGN